jgi:hypothetical protein
VRLVELLTGPHGKAVVDNFAKSFGIPPDDARRGLAAIVPEIGYAVERTSLNRAGLADVIAAMGRGAPERLLQGKSDLRSAGVEGLGTEILDTLIGSKDKSRGIANRVASDTGLDAALIRQMLPAAAAVTMGALGEGAKSQMRDVLKQVPNLDASRLAARSPLPLPGELPDFGTVPDVPRPDWNDRTVGRPIETTQRPTPAPGGTLKKQTPLPIPGNNIPRAPTPYDDLPDVVRGGKVPMPQGGTLGNIIRSILGSLLGYQGGTIGSIIRLLIMRWGWRILQSVLRRVFTGR